MTATARLEFGNWNLPGIWNLGFGLSKNEVQHSSNGFIHDSCSSFRG